MRYGKLTRAEFHALADSWLEMLGGDDQLLRALIANRLGQPDFQMPKYGMISEGQLEALLNIVLGSAGGAEMLDDILKRRLVLEWKRVKPLLVSLSDGRCIPEDLDDKVLPPNTSFKLGQTDFSESSVSTHLSLTQKFYPFPDARFPSLDEVMTRFQKILQWLNSPENQENGVVNLLKGAHFLGIMPQTKVDDLGELVEALAEAAGRSYLKQYPERAFNNYRKGELKGLVGVAEGVRYQQFLQRLSEGSLIWLSFRTCLQGFSLPAARQQEGKMPEPLILCGAVDTAMDVLAYPEILACNYQTVGQDCSANTWRSGRSLFFQAVDGRLGFDGRFLGAGESCSSGFLLPA